MTYNEEEISIDDLTSPYFNYNENYPKLEEPHLQHFIETLSSFFIKKLTKEIHNIVIAYNDSIPNDSAGNYYKLTNLHLTVTFKNLEDTKTLGLYTFKL